MECFREFFTALSSYTENLPMDAKCQYLPLLMELILCVTKHHQLMTVISYHTWLFKQVFTTKQFKARKGLKAYNQFISGWKKEIAEKYVMSGQVNTK